MRELGWKGGLALLGAYIFGFLSFIFFIAEANGQRTGATGFVFLLVYAGLQSNANGQLRKRRMASARETQKRLVEEDKAWKEQLPERIQAYLQAAVSDIEAGVREDLKTLGNAQLDLDQKVEQALRGHRAELDHQRRLVELLGAKFDLAMSPQLTKPTVEDAAVI